MLLSIGRRILKSKNLLEWWRVQFSSASTSWSPQQYDKFKKERSQPFYDLISMVKPVSNATMIDLGCGSGALTAEAHDVLKCKLTTGIDSSVEMLKVGQKLNISGLSFSQGDASKWNSPSRDVDIVISNAALQWCPNHEPLFSQLKDSLKTNGQIAIQMPYNHDYATHVLAKVMSHEEPWSTLLKQDYYNQKSHLLDLEGYALLLYKLGFKEQNVLLRVYGHILPTREDVVQWVKGSLLTHFKSRLSIDDFERFEAAYRTRLFTVLTDDKPFFYPFKRLFIWGRL